VALGEGDEDDGVRPREERWFMAVAARCFLASASTSTRSPPRTLITSLFDAFMRYLAVLLLEESANLLPPLSSDSPCSRRHASAPSPCPARSRVTGRPVRRSRILSLKISTQLKLTDDELVWPLACPLAAAASTQPRMSAMALGAIPSCLVLAPPPSPNAVEVGVVDDEGGHDGDGEEEEGGAAALSEASNDPLGPNMVCVLPELVWP